MRVWAVVQATERRRPLAERLSRKLARSDLDGHEVLYQQPGTDPWQHFWNVFAAMQRADADLVIRFEEDALTGKHLKHNVTTWPVIKRPRFGCGWLYSPPASVLDYIYHRRLDNPSTKQFLEGSVAVLFWRKELEWMVPAFQEWARRCPAGYAYDFCISAVMREKKRELWSHDPPIVEHDIAASSAFGHTMSAECRAGIAKLDWKRPGNPASF